ncbi:MAG TPA: hypothetical protein PKI71_04945, partial [Candidatus Rifleibacterium sp.]|nr:hypothetical protein [Candidatus Rifleibacterium sp.]
LNFYTDSSGAAYQPGYFFADRRSAILGSIRIDAAGCSSYLIHKFSLSRTALSCAVLHKHILCKTSLRKSNPGFSPRLPKTIFNELLYNNTI